MSDSRTESFCAISTHDLSCARHGGRTARSGRGCQRHTQGQVPQAAVAARSGPMRALAPGVEQWRTSRGFSDCAVGSARVMASRAAFPRAGSCCANLSTHRRHRRRVRGSTTSDRARLRPAPAARVYRPVARSGPAGARRHCDAPMAHRALGRRVGAVHDWRTDLIRGAACRHCAEEGTTRREGPECNGSEGLVSRRRVPGRHATEVAPADAREFVPRRIPRLAADLAPQKSFA
jgi:hypothetical protein